MLLHELQSGCVKMAYIVSLTCSWGESVLDRVKPTHSVCFCFSCCLDLFLFIGQILQMQEPALFKHIKLPKNLSPICHSWFPLDKNSWNAGNCDYLSLIRACIQVACFFFNLSKGPPLVITCLQSSSSCLGSTESYCMYSTVHSSVLTRLKIIKHNGLKRFIKTNRIISILF